MSSPRDEGEAAQVGELSEDVERRLDALYREAPEEFVAGRDALARELRGAGEREAAAAVKKLRRPSAAASVINRLSAEDPERTRALVAASDELADAQRRVLEGDAPGEELRAAAASERQQIEALVAEARRITAGGSGNVANVVERVAETLRAVGADGELRAQVLRGRVEKERSAATVGLPGAITLAKPARRGPKPGAVDRARRELSRLRRELSDLERRRDRDEAAVAEAEEDLRSARSALADSKRAIRELERRVKKAEDETGE